ncbi:MAG: DNA primase [Candidatus Acetothermia bacterium]|jgi:DNA primase|nr:DNA primase [Candidatus Acetothermia bacterium]MDH7505218.1 DNA primase [Candidatus Acetothermia bacterium]
MATREELDLIRERVDAVAVLSRYLALKRSGKNYMAICPFHPDKRPSMVLDPEKKLFHCFGCGEGGDIFKFLMKIERLSFQEAVERLGRETGVELARRGPGSPLARLYELNERVADYFQKNLQDEPGTAARRYLLERGITAESCERFRLGYALPGWDSLLRRFGRTEEDQRLLSQLGLVVQAREGGYYDRFRDRLIFPLADPQGRVIGFAGRLLREREGDPKYLNIANTPLFTKGEALFALHLARQAKGSATYAELILVEGYLDAISLHQAGFTNAVATMGTALTEQQAQLLRRYAERVVLAYDRDAAGEAASLRGMRALRNAGLEVLVALLPSEEDPDSLIREGGAAAFQAVREQALPFHKFYVAHLAAQAPDRDPLRVERLLAEAGSFIEGIASRPLRHELIRGLAEAFGLAEEEVELEVARQRRPAQAQPGPRARAARPGGPAAPWGPEEHLLYFLIQGDLSLDQARQELEPRDFTRYPRLIEAIFAQQGDGPLRPERLLEVLEEADQRTVTELALSQVEFTDRERAIRDALAALRLPRLERELRELKQKLLEAEEHGEREVAQRLLAEQRERQGLLRSLRKGVIEGQRR